MVKKLCGQSNSANVESKVIATLLGDSSDYFLLGIRYSVLSQTSLELASLLLPLYRKRGWRNKQNISRKSFGERMSKQTQGVLEKNNWLSFGWKKRPKSDFFPPSILWSAPRTKESRREEGGLTASCTCYESLVQHPCCVMISSVTLGKSLTSAVIRFPCCKTWQIIQASLTVGPCGEVVELWSTWTIFEWRPRVNELYLVPYLKWDSQMSTEYQLVLCGFFWQTAISYILFFFCPWRYFCQIMIARLMTP